MTEPLRKRIASQEPFPGYVLTTYEDGTAEELPYRVDQDGGEYVELFPNDPVDADELREDQSS